MSLTEYEGGGFTRADDPGEPTTGKPRVSVTPEEGEILAELAAGLNVLEIGTGLGVSTRYLASTARTVDTIDIDPWVEENVMPGLQELRGVFPRNSRPMDMGYDLVFIDGDHQPDALRSDLEYAYYVLALPHIVRDRHGGMVVCHDARAAHVWSVLLDHASRGTWEFRNTAHGLAIQRVLP